MLSVINIYISYNIYNLTIILDTYEQAQRKERQIFLSSETENHNQRKKIKKLPRKNYDNDTGIK